MDDITFAEANFAAGSDEAWGVGRRQKSPQMRELTSEELGFVAGGGISQIPSGTGNFNFGFGSKFIHSSVVAGPTTNATITTIVEGTFNFGGANGANG